MSLHVFRTEFRKIFCENHPDVLCPVCERAVSYYEHVVPVINIGFWKPLTEGHEECVKEIDERIRKQNEEYEADRRAEYMAKLREKCFDGAAQSERTFDTIKIFRSNKNAIDEAKAWETRQKGICFYGPTGTGKTHLLVAIANAVLSTQAECYYGRPVPYARLVKLGRFFSKLFAADLEDREDMLMALESVRYLLIDDFGMEKLTDFTEATIERILDYRLENAAYGLTTFFSTNFSPGSIADRFSPRIKSRVDALVDYVELQGKDMRSAMSRSEEDRTVIHHTFRNEGDK